MPSGHCAIRTHGSGAVKSREPRASPDLTRCCRPAPRVHWVGAGTAAATHCTNRGAGSLRPTVGRADSDVASDARSDLHHTLLTDLCEGPSSVPARGGDAGGVEAAADLLGDRL